MPQQVLAAIMSMNGRVTTTKMTEEGANGTLFGQYQWTLDPKTQVLKANGYEHTLKEWKDGGYAKRHVAENVNNLEAGDEDILTMLVERLTAMYPVQVPAAPGAAKTKLELLTFVNTPEEIAQRGQIRTAAADNTAAQGDVLGFQWRYSPLNGILVIGCYQHRPQEWIDLWAREHGLNAGYALSAAKIDKLKQLAAKLIEVYHPNVVAPPPVAAPVAVKEQEVTIKIGEPIKIKIGAQTVTITLT